MNWALLKNSLLVGGSTALATTLIGFAAAIWVMGLKGRTQRAVVLMAVLNLCLPHFLVVSVWLSWFGNTGSLKDWIPWNLFFSIPGSVLILTLLFWPVALLAIVGSLQKIDHQLVESATELGGGQLIRWILWPAARSGATLGFILVFILAFNNFTVPSILQVKVFPAELYLQFNTTMDIAGALLMSWPMVLCPIALLCWLWRCEVSWPRLSHSLGDGLIRKRLGGVWWTATGFIAVVAVGFGTIAPMTDLLVSAETWNELAPAFNAGQRAIWNSAIFASVSATLLIVTSSLTWRHPLTVVSWIPFLVPGTLLGVSIILLFNHRIGAGFYHSAGIVFFALVIRYFPIGWNGVALGLRSLDRELVDAARSDGAEGLGWWRRIVLPLSSWQIGGAWYLTYIFCLWDVETLIFIIPPGADTLALRIFNLLHYGHNAQVNALCLILLLLAAAPILLWHGWGFARQWLDRGRWPLTITFIGIPFFLGGCSDSNGPPTRTRLDSRLFSHVEVIGAKGTALGKFNKPRSIAVDREDNLYVVDMTGRVQKFSPDGEYLSYWRLPVLERGRPKGMCQDADGNIVVVEPHYARVNHFSPSGGLISQWGTKGAEPGYLTLPRAAAVNSKGQIIVSEYSLAERIQCFDPGTKQFVFGFGQAGSDAGEFNRPEGLGIDAADAIYVADSCNHRIQVFSPKGEFLRSYGEAGSDPGHFSYPYDIRIDAEGNQFVCEFGNSRIQIFDETGSVREIIGGPGSAAGQFNNPWSIALDSRGNLYVADSANHRVQKLIRQKPLAAGPSWRARSADGLSARVSRRADKPSALRKAK